MKKFKKIILWIVALQFIFTLICFLLAPESVVTHFGFQGIDSVGPRYFLFLEPLCTLMSGLLVIWVTRVRRRDNGIGDNLEVLTTYEGMLLTGQLIIGIVMSVLILDQIGVTRILQLY